MFELYLKRLKPKQYKGECTEPDLLQSRMLKCGMKQITSSIQCVNNSIQGWVQKNQKEISL